MKRLLLILSYFVSISLCYSQTLSDCKFTISASEKLYNNEYRLFRYSIRNVDQKDADNINKLLNLRVGDAIVVNEDFLCSKLSPVIIYKKYFLSTVTITIDSLNDPTYKRVNMRFDFSK